MKFRIDLKIVIFLLLFFITRQIKIYALIMLFAIIHEFGHLLAGIILGMKPNKMEIKPFGVSIQFDIATKDYTLKIKKGNVLELKKIFVASAGPITNVLIIVICILSSKWLESLYIQKIIIFSNLLLIIFNILPIYPLDGGRILKSVIYIFKGKKIAEKCIHRISYITLIVITIASSIGILYLQNIAIFIVVLYLWGMQLKEQCVYRKRKMLYDIISNCK